MKKIIISTLILLLGLPLSAAEAMNILLIPSSLSQAYLPQALPPLSQDSRQFELLYSQWLFDTHTSSFSWRGAHRLLQARFLQSGGIEVRGEQPTDEPAALTDYLSAALYYGRWLDWQNWHFHGGANILYERLWYASSFGIAADFSFSRALSENLSLGGGLLHLGKMNTLDDDPTPLPMRAFGGLDYSYDILSMSVYGLLNRDGEPGAVIHSSFKLVNAAKLNASYATFEKAFMAGADIIVKEWTLAFGFVYFQENLQSPLLFSVQR